MIVVSQQVIACENAPSDQWSCTKNSCSRGVYFPLGERRAQQTCWCVRSGQDEWTVAERSNSQALQSTSSSQSVAEAPRFPPAFPPLVFSQTLHQPINAMVYRIPNSTICTACTAQWCHCWHIYICTVYTWAHICLLNMSNCQYNKLPNRMPSLRPYQSACQGTDWYGCWHWDGRCDLLAGAFGTPIFGEMVIGVGNGTIQKSDGGFPLVLHCYYCAISNHPAAICDQMSLMLK